MPEKHFAFVEVFKYFSNLLWDNICFAVIISAVIWLKPDSNQIRDEMSPINETLWLREKDVMDQRIHESFFAQINQILW